MDIDIGNLWKPIVGGIAGSIVTGVTTAIANNIQANARSNASQYLNQTNEKRSGVESFNRATQAGIAEGIDQQNAAQNLAASVSQTGSSRMGNAMNAMNDVNNNNQFNQGFNAESSRSRENDRQAMNRARINAENQISQADVNAGVVRQAGQSILDTVGGGLNLYNQIGSMPKSEEGSKLVTPLASQAVGI